MEVLIEKISMKNRSTEINWRSYQRDLIPIGVIILCALVFDYWSGGSFITPRNLSNLSRQICVNLTLAVGMTLVILTSGIDLSVGSVLALSGMTAAISQVHWQWSGMGVAVEGAVDDEVDDEVDDAVDDEVGDEVYEAVYGAVEGAVSAAVREAVKEIL